MSKAFTRESDVPELPVRPRLAPVLPVGAKNYLTASGAAELRRELDRLVNVERARLTVAGDDEAKAKLQEIDLRVAQIQHTLSTAVVVGPPPVLDGVVRFGATVKVRESNGTEADYRIVGVDETDLDRNWVSWLSPIAKALLNAKPGQRVRLKLPTGETELEILSVSYE